MDIDAYIKDLLSPTTLNYENRKVLSTKNASTQVVEEKTNDLINLFEDVPRNS